MDPLLATNFRFRVTLSPAGQKDPAPGSLLGDGNFQECSGLEVEMDVGEYVEGGRTNGVLQRAGRMKVSRVVLKRGLFHSPDGVVSRDLWSWFQDVVDGVRPLRRYDGTIAVLGEKKRVVAEWKFTRGLPAKVVGPQLNAKSGDVAMEELHIAHEGLRMVAPSAPKVPS
jgi:phage tail-like protein